MRTKRISFREMPPPKRREEIGKMLIEGILRTESAMKPPGEKLSEFTEKALEVPAKTRLCVATG